MTEEDGEVDRGRDGRARADHDPLGDVPLDVEAQDLLSTLCGLVRVVRELDSAGLAAAADLHLRLDDDRAAAERLRTLLRVLRGVCDLRTEHGDSVLLEEVTRLILEKIHVHSFVCCDAGGHCILSIPATPPGFICVSTSEGLIPELSLDLVSIPGMWEGRQ